MAVFLHLQNAFKAPVREVNQSLCLDARDLQSGALYVGGPVEKLSICFCKEVAQCSPSISGCCRPGIHDQDGFAGREILQTNCVHPVQEVTLGPQSLCEVCLERSGQTADSDWAAEAGKLQRERLQDMRAAADLRDGGFEFTNPVELVQLFRAAQRHQRLLFVSWEELADENAEICFQYAEKTCHGTGSM